MKHKQHKFSTGNYATLNTCHVAGRARRKEVEAENVECQGGKAEHVRVSDEQHEGILVVLTDAVVYPMTRLQLTVDSLPVFNIVSRNIDNA